MTDVFPGFGGVAIIESMYALSQTTVRLFPVSRHRSARIRKKLLKRFGCEFKMEPAAVRVGDTLIIHPSMMSKVRSAAREQARKAQP